MSGKSVANSSEQMVDTSYKSAATNSVTWSAMDAKRDDGAVYNIAYYNK